MAQRSTPCSTSSDVHSASIQHIGPHSVTAEEAADRCVMHVLLRHDLPCLRIMSYYSSQSVQDLFAHVSRFQRIQCRQLEHKLFPNNHHGLAPIRHSTDGQQRIPIHSKGKMRSRRFHTCQSRSCPCEKRQRSQSKSHFNLPKKVYP